MPPSIPIFFWYHYPVKSANPDYNYSILAVMSSFSNHTKEDLLRLVKAADPSGERTLCVLTHADVMKSSVQTTFHSAREDTHGLGCFWVRNRGADELDLSAAQCKMRELALFAEPRWASFSTVGRTGVDALKSALQMSLRDLASECLDRQRTTVLERLSSCKNELQALGPARDTPDSQREYLMVRISRFEGLTTAALDGQYGADRAFSTNRVYRLATDIADLNYEFCSRMRERGHLYYFKNDVDDGLVDCRTEYYVQALNRLRDWAGPVDELGEFLLAGMGGEEYAFKTQEYHVKCLLNSVIGGPEGRGLELSVSLRPSGPRKTLCG